MSKIETIFDIWQYKFNEILFPNYINFIITRECNSRCSFCNIWKKPEPGKPLEEIIEAFSQLKLYDLKWFQITGGEPFLYPDLVGFVNFLHSHYKKPLIWIPTNGISTKRIVESVKQMKKVNITISLDGTKNIHNKIRGGNFHKKAIDTAKQVSNLGVNTCLGFTISDDNYKEISYVYDLSKNLGVGFSCRPVNGSSVYYNNKEETIGTAVANLLNNDKKIKYLEKFFNSIDPKNRYYKLILKYISKPSKQIFPCTALANSFHLSHDLNVYPCLFMNNNLGNVKDVYNIWEGNELAELRMKIHRGDCPNCCVECETCRNLTFYPLRWIK